MSRTILEQLQSAENVLRSVLFHHGLDLTARAHTERALAHVREAYVATNEIGKARSVPQLLHDLEKVESMLERVRQQDEAHSQAKTNRI